MLTAKPAGLLAKHQVTDLPQSESNAVYEQDTYLYLCLHLVVASTFLAKVRFCQRCNIANTLG